MPLGAADEASNQASGASLLHFWSVFTTLHDKAALILRESLRRHSGATTLSDERAAVVALGMPLAYLKFYAKFDLWAKAHLGARGSAVFDSVALSISNGELSAYRADSLFDIIGQINRRRSESDGITARPMVQMIERLFLGEAVSHQLVCSALATFEVVRWAESRGSDSSTFVQAYLDWRPLPDQVAHLGWRVVRDVGGSAWDLFDRRITHALSPTTGHVKRALPKATGLLSKNPTQVPVYIHGGGAIAAAL